MIDENKLEIWLSGYLEGLIGHTFTKDHYDKTFNVIDDILHKIHAEELNSK